MELSLIKAQMFRHQWVYILLPAVRFANMRNTQPKMGNIPVRLGGFRDSVETLETLMFHFRLVAKNIRLF